MRRSSAMDSLVYLVNQARASESGSGTVLTNTGEEIFFEKSPSAGVLVRLVKQETQEAQGWWAMQTAPTATRPDAYPSRLPFLPEVSAARSVA